MRSEGKWWTWVRRTFGLAAVAWVLVVNPHDLPPWLPVLIAALLFGPDVLDYQLSVNKRREEKDQDS